MPIKYFNLENRQNAAEGKSDAEVNFVISESICRRHSAWSVVKLRYYSMEFRLNSTACNLILRPAHNNLSKCFDGTRKMLPSL